MSYSIELTETEGITLLVYLVFAIVLIPLIPFTIAGIKFVWSFHRHGKYETKKYTYWREKRNVR